MDSAVESLNVYIYSFLKLSERNRGNVRALQASVRHSADGWSRPASETDPLLLATLLGEWFRRLRVPPVTASVILPQVGGLLESEDRMNAVRIINIGVHTKNELNCRVKSGPFSTSAMSSVSFAATTR